MAIISSPDRIVYPETATTKAQVVGHYTELGESMLVHIAQRPLTLQRFPHGVAAPGFMQKNTPEHYPAFITRCELPRSGGVTVHPVVHDVAGIEYLANQNTITFHMPTARCDDLMHPDRLIIDLDPADGPGASVHEAAWATKELLDQLGLESVPVATGSKGFHVTVAAGGDLDMATVGELAQLAAVVLVDLHPDLFTLEFRKANRGGRVFCDWLRNRWGSTTVTPWSLRPRRRPTVAVPITWDELDGTAPDAFELGSLPAADPLHSVPAIPGALPAAHRQLTQMAGSRGLELQPFDRFRS